MAQRIEDQFGHVQQLILIAKDRGYLLYDEINDSLPPDVHSSHEIEELLALLERNGIEIYEDAATADATRAAASALEDAEAARHQEPGDEAALDLSFDADTKSQDPVRLYLRCILYTRIRPDKNGRNLPGQYSPGRIARRSIHWRRWRVTDGA